MTWNKNESTVPASQESVGPPNGTESFNDFNASPYVVARKAAMTSLIERFLEIERIGDHKLNEVRHGKFSFMMEFKDASFDVIHSFVFTYKGTLHSCLYDFRRKVLKDPELETHFKQMRNTWICTINAFNDLVDKGNGFEESDFEKVKEEIEMRAIGMIKGDRTFWEIERSLGDDPDYF